MIITIHVFFKAFDKTKHVLIVKVLERTTKGNLNIIKSIYEKPTAIIILNAEKK